MDPLNRHIRWKWRVKGNETLPFTGWHPATREDIPDLFRDFGYKIGAEVGVQVGTYSKIILDKNPGLKLYCVDSWAPYSRTSQERQDMRFRRAQRTLSGYDVTFIKKKSMDALVEIPDGHLDFVYIDAMHDFDNVMMDIIGWSNKVRSGGIISGHDYTTLHNCGVIPAVNAYIAGHNITQWYVTQEYLSSFLWVKP